MQSSCFHCLLIIDKPLIHIYMSECHLYVEYIWHKNLHHLIYVVSSQLWFITLKFPLDARLLKNACEVQNCGSWKSGPHPKRNKSWHNTNHYTYSSIWYDLISINFPPNLQHTLPGSVANASIPKTVPGHLLGQASKGSPGRPGVGSGNPAP